MSNSKYKIVIEHGHAQAHEGTAAAINNTTAVRFGIQETVINGKPVVDTLSQRPCNVILRQAMKACANAFLPERSELQERAEDADSVETMRELLAEFIADMTEYGAMAGAHQLRKAAHAKEDDQVSAVMAAYKLIGAPGDFGYETRRGGTWYAVLQTYDAVLKERRAVLDAEAAASDLPQAPVEKKACPVDGEECDRCHGCRTTACEDAADMPGTNTVGAECQKVINRLLEGLELIAAMPAVDPALNITRASVVAQYDEARDTAQLTLDQYARNGGVVVDRAALDGEVSNG